jgi:hypothetical protein
VTSGVPFLTGFNPDDWHVDLQTSYVTYLPRGLGFSIDFRFRSFDTDELSPGDFAAELIHAPASGEVPGYAELMRLGRVAATRFGMRYLAWLEQRKQSTHQSDTDEDAIMTKIEAYDQVLDIFTNVMHAVTEAKIPKTVFLIALADLTADVALMGGGEPGLDIILGHMKGHVRDFREGRLKLENY